MEKGRGQKRELYSVVRAAKGVELGKRGREGRGEEDERIHSNSHHLFSFLSPPSPSLPSMSQFVNW